MKNQKGAISLFVLLAMLFFLTFMIGTYTFVSRRNATQEESLREIQAIYSSGSSASDIYDSILSTIDTVVPVSNKEQLAKIVEINNSTDTQANYMINGKVYTYKKDASYVLENDIILDLKEEINGKNNINIYDYLLYDNVDANGHNIYYAHADGSLWKCISYQNIGNDEESNVFSQNTENANYYGKSYTSNLYSILENEMDNYKKAWDSETNYEFILMYNFYNEKFDLEKHNRWRQTNNPTQETTTNSDGSNKEKVAGYNAIATDGLGTENYFGGLIKSSGNSYLKSFVGESNYPVALTALTNNTINVINDNTATECLLFVRVK